MATQDDINGLTKDIEREEQSATILDKQAEAERLTSGQKIDGWQQQAGRHRDAANQMRRDLESKQQLLSREREQAAEEARKSEKAKEIAKTVAARLM